MRESAAHLGTSDVEPLPAVGVKRGCSGEREDSVRLSRSDKLRVLRDLDSELIRTRDAFYQLLRRARRRAGGARRRARRDLRRAGRRQITVAEAAAERAGLLERYLERLRQLRRQYLGESS